MFDDEEWGMLKEIPDTSKHISRDTGSSQIAADVRRDGSAISMEERTGTRVQ